MWIYCWNRTPGPTDKRHSFRSRLNMRFLLWLHSPTLCIARGTFCFFFSSPSNPPHPLSYSSIPPSPLLVVPFFLRFRAMTRPVRSVLLTRTRIDWEDEPWRGNNKARDHVYHTLLDTVSHHGPPWNRVSWSWFASLKDVRFGHTRYIFKLSLRRFAVSFGRVSSPGGFSIWEKRSRYATCLVIVVPTLFIHVVSIVPRMPSGLREWNKKKKKKKKKNSRYRKFEVCAPWDLL